MATVLLGEYPARYGIGDCDHLGVHSFADLFELFVERQQLLEMGDAGLRCDAFPVVNYRG